MSNLPVEFQPVVARIVDAMSKGVEAPRLEQYLRDTGWFEVNGQELSREVFQGLVSISLHQMTMQTGVPEGIKTKRNEAYSLARSIAMAAMMSGDLKNANAAVANMVKIVETMNPPKDKAPKDARRPAVPDISFDDLAKHIQHIQPPQPPEIELPPTEQGAPDAGDL